MDWANAAQDHHAHRRSLTSVAGDDAGLLRHAVDIAGHAALMGYSQDLLA